MCSRVQTKERMNECRKPSMRVCRRGQTRRGRLITLVVPELPTACTLGTDYMYMYMYMYMYNMYMYMYCTDTSRAVTSSDI